MIPGQWGNWAQARAYWCPGMAVQPIRTDITALVTPGSANTIDYEGAFRAGASPGLRTPGRGSKAAHARDAARALQAGISPNSGGVLARASLEQELGEFGISGLERAD